MSHQPLNTFVDFSSHSWHVTWYYWILIYSVWRNTMIYCQWVTLYTTAIINPLCIQSYSLGINQRVSPMHCEYHCELKPIRVMWHANCKHLKWLHLCILKPIFLPSYCHVLAKWRWLGLQAGLEHHVLQLGIKSWLVVDNLIPLEPTAMTKRLQKFMV